MFYASKRNSNILTLTNFSCVTIQFNRPTVYLILLLQYPAYIYSILIQLLVLFPL